MHWAVCALYDVHSVMILSGSTFLAIVSSHGNGATVVSGFLYTESLFTPVQEAECSREKHRRHRYRKEDGKRDSEAH